MTDFFAGYILQCLRQHISKTEETTFWKEVCGSLSAFYCRNSLLNNGGNEKEHPVFSVLDNQLSRGLPTLPSIHIERVFSKTFELTKEIEKNGSINFECNSFTDSHLRCLILADTRSSEINREVVFQTWEEHNGSEVEQQFFQSLVNKFGPCLNQLIQLQRSIDSVTNSHNVEDLFVQQTMDFLLEFPESTNFAKGLVIEIDGRQHIEEPQLSKDKRRDFYSIQNHYQPVRISTRELNAIPESKLNIVRHYLEHPYAQTFFRNINKPLWNSEVGLDFLQLTLSPFGIARVQKALIKAFKKGLIDLGKESIEIAIIERDIPCGKLAIEDLCLQVEHLSTLQNRLALALPKFNVHLYVTPEFKASKLNADSKSELFSDESDFTNFDLVIDVSVLNNSNFLNRPTKSLPKKTIVIRSLHYTQEKRKFNFHPPINYLGVPDNSAHENEPALTFFLQSLFRKNSFREGQLQILQKALQQKNPIALLPTGAGKSLTYQLASLLQAGLTVVVDPIKSLMKDQNENLRQASIDATLFINSSLLAKEKNENTRRFTEGEALFAFVSPERFVIQKFRDTISSILAYKRYFAYCVIDEAHCVSEWGHDFRTPYLRLGNNARKFCPTGNGAQIPLLGLTGTASFDVLSDVQREVGLPIDEAPVRPAKSERPELEFRIVSVQANLNGAKTDRNIQAAVYSSTRAALLNVLNNDLISSSDAESFPDFIKAAGDDSRCGLIFCPHAKGTDISVQHIAQYLRSSFPTIAHLIGEFHGSSENSDAIQDDFKSNRKTLLIATKAFGMGIDKPNVRFTIHLTHPISIEGFYQEAGRAGRDRQHALCYILHSKNLTHRNGNTVARELQESFLYNSFKGRKYEKNITMDLLDRVAYPHLPMTGVLEAQIAEELGHEIKLNLFPANNPHTVYVNGVDRAEDYGNINLVTLNVGGIGNALAADEATYFLNELAAYIRLKKPNGIDAAFWLKTVVANHERSGLEAFFNAIPLGEIQTLSIGLDNDGLNRIIEYLKEDYPKITTAIVKNATNFCKTEAEFVRKLGWALDNVVFQNEQVEGLMELYTLVRFSSDTLKVVHRLTTLGVVDDYTIDYGTNTVNLFCKRLTDEAILNKLGKYIGHYKGENAVQNAINDAKGRSHPTTLRNCLDYLIDFAYDQIFSKRTNALSNIETAVGSEDNRQFAINVNDYFDSSYRDVLYKDTAQAREGRTETLLKYIDDVLDDRNKQQQLRASALRLTEVNPDNPLFSWLAYYCSILLKDRDEDTIQKYFDKGFNDYHNGSGLSYKELDKLIEQIGKRIKMHDNTSFTRHEQHIAVLETELANNYLKTLTQQFLTEYVQ